MAAPGVVLVQTFPYRGAPEEYSNLYHFVGSAPSTDADWESLNDALAGLVGAALNANTKIIRAYDYENTDDDAVFVDDLLTRTGGVTGSQTFPGSGAQYTPGDAAVWVRWKTARVNSHGKPIYLRKYYHSPFTNVTDTEGDTITGGMQTALADLGTALNASSGDWPGLAGPDGVAPGASAISPFVTTRTLRRRGKRPH